MAIIYYDLDNGKFKDDCVAYNNKFTENIKSYVNGYKHGKQDSFEESSKMNNLYVSYESSRARSEVIEDINRFICDQLITYRSSPDASKILDELNNYLTNLKRKRRG